MLIQYRTTGHRREVADSIGRRLVGSRIADPAHTEPEAASSYQTADLQAEGISPRTGKPKRKYKRRDLRAAD